MAVAFAKNTILHKFCGKGLMLPRRQRFNPFIRNFLSSSKHSSLDNVAYACHPKDPYLGLQCPYTSLEFVTLLNPCYILI